MLIVAGFNMISGLLILILEKTNMIGILKALGSEDSDNKKSFPVSGCIPYRQRDCYGEILSVSDWHFFSLKQD